eukprot:s349_g16.t1
MASANLETSFAPYADFEANPDGCDLLWRRGSIRALGGCVDEGVGWLHHGGDLRPADRYRPRQAAGLPQPPKVSVHATADERNLLYQKMADGKRLAPVFDEDVERRLFSGLFCVPKDLEKDRLILDAKPPNLAEGVLGSWTSTMASATSLAGIELEPQENLLTSGRDSKISFTSSKFLRSVLGFLQKISPSFLGGLSLRAAMFAVSGGGDRRFGVAFEKVLAADVEKTLEKGTGLDRRMKKVMEMYQAVGLPTNEKKAFDNAYLSAFWGMQLDGKKGLMRCNESRMWPLVLITTRVVSLGLTTIGLLRSLAGSFISVLSLRRRLLSAMNFVFDAIAASSSDAQVVRLSDGLKDELFVLATLTTLSVVNLRAATLPKIRATDASDWGTAAVSTDVPVEVAREAMRLGLSTSVWTKLLPAQKAWLRSKLMLEPDDELPGEHDQFDVHPFWEALARSVPYFTKGQLRRHGLSRNANDPIEHRNVLDDHFNNTYTSMRAQHRHMQKRGQQSWSIAGPQQRSQDSNNSRPQQSAQTLEEAQLQWTLEQHTKAKEKEKERTKEKDMARATKEKDTNKEKATEATAHTTKEKPKENNNRGTIRKEETKATKERQKECLAKEKERTQQHCATDVANQVTWQKIAEQLRTACQKHRKSKTKMEQRNGATDDKNEDIRSHRDISTAFLHAAAATADLFMYPPAEFYNAFDQIVWRLNKAIYGLRSSPKAWKNHLAEVMQQLGQRRLVSEPNVYATLQGDAYILCYVDDLLFIGQQETVNKLFKQHLLLRPTGELTVGNTISFLGRNIWNLQQR